MKQREKDLQQKKFYTPSVREEKIKSICRELRCTREAIGLTQKELSERSGKRRNVISKIETEGGNITLKTLLDIVEGGMNGSVEIKIDVD